MLRLVTTVLTAACLLTLPASAQTENTTDPAGSSAQGNAGGGTVGDGTPGSWVRAAIARHTTLMDRRLRGPRFGVPNTEEAELRFGGSGAGSSAVTGGLTGLLDLVSQFGSLGSLGDLGGLGDLIGNLAGTEGSTEASTGETSAGEGGGATIPPPANGTEYTLEDLIAMGETLGGSQKRRDAEQASVVGGETVAKTGPTQTRNGRTFGGAIARLPKPEQRFQETTTTELDFKTRWANAMLQTFFTALAVGLQSNDFIETLKDGLRPLILPPAADTGNGAGDGIEDIPPADDGGGIEDIPPADDDGSGDSGDGGGIEDIPPADDGEDDGGSTI